MYDRYDQISLFSEPSSNSENEQTKQDSEATLLLEHDYKPIASSLAEHPIHCRDNVYYCIHNQSAYKNHLFHYTCKITGQTWSAEPWSHYRDYEKKPSSPTPCDTCLLARCEWCAFRQNKPCTWEACSSCANSNTCQERTRKKDGGGGADK